MNVNVAVTGVGASSCTVSVQVDRAVSSSYCGMNVTCSPMSGTFGYPCSTTPLNVTMYVPMDGCCCSSALSHRIIGWVRSPSYVDHSILEVYANDRFALTTRVYPEYEVAHSVVLTTYGGDPGFVSSFTATPMTAVMNLPPRTPSGPTGLAWWAWALIVVGAVVVVVVAAAVGRHVYIARRGTGRHYVGMGDNSTPDEDVDRHPAKPASPPADGL